MNDLTPERARALELYRLHFRLTRDYESVTISPDQLGNLANTWLAVEAHALASHTCPDVESDPRIRAWLAIAAHPFFAACYQTKGTLVDAMVAKLDAAHANWGTAHHQDEDSYWRTEAGALLAGASLGWTYETTAPLPEPEPDPRVDVVAQELHDGSACEDAWPSCTVSTVEHYRGAAIDLLARLDALPGGERS